MTFQRELTYEDSVEEVEPAVLPHEKRLVSEQSLASLTKEQLQILCNAIFSYGDYQLRSADLARNFSATCWYESNPEFSDALLNQTELANVELIRAKEQSR